MSIMSSRFAELCQAVLPSSRRIPSLSPDSAYSSRAEQGLTLMECLVAIAVIALTSAMIGPPLVLSAATRLQNQRVEQALQIAQGEVDRLQALVSLSEHQRRALPNVTNVANLEAQAGPRGAIAQMRSIDDTCSTYNGDPLPTDQVLPIDIDGDCEEDFLMQVFRDDGEFSGAEDNRGASGRPSRFNMMVRVYAANASENFGSLDNPEPASLRFTSGQGNQRERPLAVLTSQLSWSDSDGSLFCYHGDCDD